MNKKLTIAQVVNVIGFSDLIFHVMNRSYLGEYVFNAGMKLSAFLIFGSLAAIVIVSYSFINSHTKEGVSCSSFLSPILKFFLPNGMIAFLIAILIQGCFFDVKMLRLFLVFSLITSYPILIYVKSVYVILKGKEVRLYNYSDDFETVNAKQIEGIKKVFLGMMYKIKYEDADGISKARYFFPTGNLFFFFFEPASVKTLKSIM